VAQKPGTTLCTDYYTKDRRNGDLAESISHSLGADTHRLVLLQGCMNTGSLFTSFLMSPSKMLQTHFEVIAASFNLGLCLSLRHLRNIPIACAGTL